MKFTSGILLFGGVAAALYYGKLIAAASDMQIIFKTFNVINPISYEIVLTAQNPTNATIKILSIVGAVTINGNDLGNISDFDEVVIMPNSQIDITLKLGLSVLSLPGVISNLISTGRGTYQFGVTGTFNLNGDDLPLDLDKTISF